MLHLQLHPRHRLAYRSPNPQTPSPAPATYRLTPTSLCALPPCAWWSWALHVLPLAFARGKASPPPLCFFSAGERVGLNAGVGGWEVDVPFAIGGGQ